MSIESLVLTHGDVDGMACAMLLLRSLPADATAIRISNGRNLERDLLRVTEMTALPGQVLIADIPRLAHMRGGVAEALAALHARGVQLRIYDHHVGWDGAPEVAPLCATYCVETQKTTAAALVWRERLRGDDASQQWLRVLSEKAASPDPGIRERFGILAALMQPQHYDLTDAVLRSLANGGDLLPDHRRLAEWYYGVHVPRERRLAAAAQVLVAASGCRLGWLDLREEQGHLMVAPLVIREHGVEVVATVTKRAVVVGGSAVDQGRDLSPLHGAHEVNGVGVRAGGHRSPISLTPMGTCTVTDEFVEAARRLLVSRL